MLSISSEHRLRAENLAFDIDVWLPRLRAFTFESEFIPLTRSEARAIINYYRTRNNLRRDMNLTTDDVGVLRALEARIDLVLRAHFPAESGGAFLRLCGRSPKDAEPLDRAAVRRNYARELQRLLEQGEPNEPSTKLMAIARVSWLRVTSGQEAMSLLLTSERVYADMIDWLQWGEPEQVVLRRWEPAMSLEYEFRAFVCNDRLCAISQYDHFGVYPHLVPLKQRIQDMIVAKWNEVHAHVAESSYVIDFAYLPIDPPRVVVIEISPYLPCTGSALFRWTTDKHLLANGPLEFRLNDRTHPQIGELVESNWDERWRNDLPPFYQFYDKAEPVDLGSASPAPSVHSSATAVGTSTNTTGGGLFRGVMRAMSSILSAGSSPTTTTTTTTTTGTSGDDSQTSAAAAAAACVPASSFGGFSARAELHRINPNSSSLIFVYGTLKRGFHWNHKFLSRSSFVTRAITEQPYPLVVGESGVPYLLGDAELVGKGQRILGEVWRIDDETLIGLDEYEGTRRTCNVLTLGLIILLTVSCSRSLARSTGVPKGYYDRRAITVCCLPEREQDEEQEQQHTGGVDEGVQQLHGVFVYVKAQPSPELWSGPFLSEYTLELHRQQYSAIRHIQVKQQKYLGMQDGAHES